MESTPHPAILIPRPRFGAGHNPVSPQDDLNPGPFEIADQRDTQPTMDPAALAVLAEAAMRDHSDATAGAGRFPTMPERMLAKFRHGHAFVPIWPLPQAVVSITLAAGVAQDIRIPDEALWFYLSGLPATPYYLAITGIAGNAAANNGYTLPLFGMSPAFYCYGRQSISLNADGANTVGAAFFTQDVSAGIR